MLSPDKESLSLEYRLSPLSTQYAGRCLHEHERLCTMLQVVLDDASPHTTLRSNGKLRGLVDLLEERIVAINHFIEQHIKAYGEVDKERLDLFYETVRRLERARETGLAHDRNSEFSGAKIAEQRQLSMARVRAGVLVEQYSRGEEPTTDLVDPMPRSIPLPADAKGKLVDLQQQPAAPSPPTSPNKSGASETNGTSTFLPASETKPTENEESERKPSPSPSQPRSSSGYNVERAFGTSSPFEWSRGQRSDWLEINKELSTLKRRKATGAKKSTTKEVGDATGSTTREVAGDVSPPPSAPAQRAPVRSVAVEEPVMMSRATSGLFVRLFLLEEENQRRALEADARDTLNELQSLYFHFTKTATAATVAVTQYTLQQQQRQQYQHQQPQWNLSPPMALAPPTQQGVPVAAAPAPPQAAPPAKLPPTKTAQKPQAQGTGKPGAISTRLEVSLFVAIAFIFGALFGGVLFPVMMRDMYAHGYIS